MKWHAWLRLAAAVTVIVSGIGAAAEDWPQFLGPERNGVSRGPALAETWPAAGPRVVWRKAVGQGFAGPVVVQGRVLSLEGRPREDAASRGEGEVEPLAEAA